MIKFKESYLNEAEKKELARSLNLKYVGYGIYKNTENKKFRWDGKSFKEMESKTGSKYDAKDDKTAQEKMKTIDGKVDTKYVYETLNLSKDSMGKHFIPTKNPEESRAKYRALFEKMKTFYDNIEERVETASASVKWYVSGKLLATFKKSNGRVYVS